jgi:hypothetical protein
MHLHVNCSAGDCRVIPVDRRGSHDGRQPSAYWLIDDAAIFISKISGFFDVFENRVRFFDQAQGARGYNSWRLMRRVICMRMHRSDVPKKACR